MLDGGMHEFLLILTYQILIHHTLDEKILLYSGGLWENVPEDVDTPADYDKHGFRTNIPSEIWNTESNLDIYEKKPVQNL